VASAAPASETVELDDREYQRQLQTYISQVMRQVYGEVKYPRRAVKYQWEGRVELLAKMAADGELLGVIIDSTSGHVGLDKAAQAAVERAAPFPELSPVAKEELVSDDGDGYIMSIPVTFALKR
jgi:TonB family protein